MNQYIGCCCAEDLVARVQACADQAVGVETLQTAKIIQPSAEQWAIHYRKLSILLQQAIDEYTAQHGEPDVHHQVGAAEWLVTALKS